MVQRGQIYVELFNYYNCTYIHLRSRTTELFYGDMLKDKANNRTRAAIGNNQ